MHTNDTYRCIIIQNIKFNYAQECVSLCTCCMELDKSPPLFLNHPLSSRDKTDDNKPTKREPIDIHKETITPLECLHTRDQHSTRALTQKRPPLHYSAHTRDQHSTECSHTRDQHSTRALTHTGDQHSTRTLRQETSTPLERSHKRPALH